MNLEQKRNHPKIETVGKGWVSYAEEVIISNEEGAVLVNVEEGDIILNGVEPLSEVVGNDDKSIVLVVVDLYPALIDIDDTLVDQLSAWEGHPISTE